MMARRNQHSSEEIRAMALAKAEQIVADEGYDALNGRRLAGGIGYTVGTLYSVFTNMADLILHLKILTLQAIVHHLQQVQADKPVDMLESFARAYLRYAASNYNRWRQLFESNCKEVPEATLSEYQKISAAIFRLIENQLARLAPAASADDLQAAAQAVGAGIHGICQLSLDGAQSRPIEAAEYETVLLTRCFVQGWLLRQKA
jgi:AcrR family transcriptional regulator